MYISIKYFEHSFDKPFVSNTLDIHQLNPACSAIMYSLQVLGFIAAISATVATAVPTTVDNFHHPPRGGGVHPTVGQVQNQCGNGQTIACCNSDSSSKGGDNNVLGSLGLNQLLGGNCQTLAVPGKIALVMQG